MKRKVILSLSLLIILPVLIIQSTTSFLIQSRIEENHRQKLEIIKRNVENIIEEHKTKLSNYVSFLGASQSISDTAFIAIFTSDASRLTQTLQGYEETLDIDSVTVIDERGRVIASSGSERTIGMDRFGQKIVSAALAGEIAVDIHDYDGIYLITAASPIIRENQIIAGIVFGIYFDDFLTQQLKRRSGADVIFTHQGAIKATTLTENDPVRLYEAIKDIGPSEVRSIEINDYQYDVRLFEVPIDDSTSMARGYLVINREAIEYSKNNMYWLLISITSITVLIALAVAYMVSASIASHQSLEHEVKTRTQELESFVYTVSHDLKSPVVSMQGMASVFMEEYGSQLNDQGRHYINRVIANADYMEQIIQDLLTFSKVSHKKKQKAADAETVVRELLSLNQERLSQQKVEVTIHTPFPSFKFDHLHLSQLFQNLLSNAIKFMGDQPNPRIEIGGQSTGRWVDFYVKDNGIGIDAAYHDRILGLFQRLKDIDVEGTGVGLSIVKKIMDLAGGQVRIESEKGKGSTFFLRFPNTPA